jgi:hypothetical protein
MPAKTNFSPENVRGHCATIAKARDPPFLKKIQKQSAAALATRGGCCEVRLSPSCFNATKPGRVYSNRVPVALPQPEKSRFPSASKNWIVAL